MGRHILVIGSGAAGFLGAIACATANPRDRVTVLEAGTTALNKVRISGGGRCSVTHHCFDPSPLCNTIRRGGQALRGAFSRFQPQDTIAWFEARGLQWPCGLETLGMGDACLGGAPLSRHLGCELAPPSVAAAASSGVGSLSYPCPQAGDRQPLSLSLAASPLELLDNHRGNPRRATLGTSR